MTTNEIDRMAYDHIREQYFEKVITHHEFYLWVAKFIGVNHQLVPVKLEELLASTDEHFNDIPLSRWDMMYSATANRAVNRGLRGWSLSDNTCVLKTLAREWIKNKK